MCDLYVEEGLSSTRTRHLKIDIYIYIYICALTYYQYKCTHVLGIEAVAMFSFHERLTSHKRENKKDTGANIGFCGARPRFVFPTLLMGLPPPRSLQP